MSSSDWRNERSEFGQRAPRGGYREERGVCMAGKRFEFGLLTEGVGTVNGPVALLCSV